MIRVLVKTPQNTPIQGSQPIFAIYSASAFHNPQPQLEAHTQKKRSNQTAMLHFPSKTPFKRTSNVKQM